MHLPDLADPKVTKSISESFDFRFNETFGWAIFTVSESAASLDVQSDWGNASYRWPLNGLPEAGRSDALKRFLVQADADYISKKLSSNSEELRRRIYDGHATQRELAGYVLEDRKAGGLSKEEARELHNECTRAAHLLNGEYPRVDIVEEMMSEAFMRFFDWSLHDYVCTREHPRLTIWRERLIPAFQRYLREQGYGESYPRAVSS